MADSLILEGTTSLAVHAETPLEQWREGTATVDVPQLALTLGELPIRLATPARWNPRGASRR